MHLGPQLRGELALELQRCAVRRGVAARLGDIRLGERGLAVPVQCLRQADENDCLIAGASQVLIKGYNIIEITLQLLTTIRKIRLVNVIFISSFYINIISLDRLI